MKVTILGTGCIWTKRACASYLVNDDIIVDPGSGTLKQLLKSSNKLLHHEKIEKIKLILITHYHADHYFDIVYLMWKLASTKNPNTSATIICPPGGKERIKTLCELAMSEATFAKLDFEKFITFVDASKIKSFEYKNFEIIPMKMDHGTTTAFGYILKEKNGKAIGFTGDSVYCKNVETLIENTQLAFVDMAGTDISSKHYNIIDGIELMKKYRGKCCIVPCHLTSQALDYCEGRINPPKDLMVLNVDDKYPYDFCLNCEEKENDLKKGFLFETKKYGKVEGEIVDLALVKTKDCCKENPCPSYYYNILLHNQDVIIGSIVYNYIPNHVEGHEDNVSFKLEKNYDMMSIKYEICTLIKKVALHHESKRLYLTCSPDDFNTRRSFESLGAYLQEIKTFTYFDEEKNRKTQEKCVWVWEIC